MPASTTKTATVAIALVISLAAVVVGCSSGGSDAATSTTARTGTSRAATTTTRAPSTTGATGSTATTAATTPAGLPPCQELLQQYTDAFSLDDLSPVVKLFRQWAPHMPPDVGAAVERIADAYDAAGDQGINLNMADRDLTADATRFSDWTNEGCPTS